MTDCPSDELCFKRKTVSKSDCIYFNKIALWKRIPLAVFGSTLAVIVPALNGGVFDAFFSGNIEGKWGPFLGSVITAIIIWIVSICFAAALKQPRSWDYFANAITIPVIIYTLSLTTKLYS